MVGSQLLTVNRVLKGLAAYSNNTCQWGVSDRARSTGLDKSQTKRILATLAVRSFLEAHPVTGRCGLGPRLAALGCLAQQASDARPLLSASARRCRESAVFCQAHGELYICAFAVDGPGPLRSAMSVVNDIPVMAAEPLAKRLLLFSLGAMYVHYLGSTSLIPKERLTRHTSQ